jgi:hypothetical protein
MSGISITTANFTSAYRGFPVEQGNDLFQANIEAEETSDLSSSTKAVAVSEAGDEVFISSAAARMYASQSKAGKQIHRRQPVDKFRRMYSSTAKEKVSHEALETGEEEKFER